MRYKFYREHKYVSFALNDLERWIAKADFRDISQAERINAEFQAVVDMLKGHAEYENTALHVLLKRKGSKVYEEVEQDHHHYDRMLADLQKRLSKVLACTDDEKRIELGYEFYLWFRKFVGDNLIHLHEEETVVLPELQRLYSDDELKLVEAETYRKMTSGQMIHMMEVLFPHMNIVDKEAFLTDVKECQPEKYALVWQGIEPHFTDAEKEYLQRR
jgi:hemerythrin-like domain-containing protein